MYSGNKENNNNNNNNNDEKKMCFWCRTDWATVQLYCEKKNLYCNIEIVLQAIGEKA